MTQGSSFLATAGLRAGIPLGFSNGTVCHRVSTADTCFGAVPRHIGNLIAQVSFHAPATVTGGAIPKLHLDRSDSRLARQITDEFCDLWNTDLFHGLNLLGCRFAGKRQEATLVLRLALNLAWIRSRPLARPSRPFAFSEFLSPLSQAAQVSSGEKEQRLSVAGFANTWPANPAARMSARRRTIFLLLGRRPG